MKYKAIIFDCDGTLLNTIKDLTNAVNYALEKTGFQPQTESDTLKMVGNGIKALVERALPESGKYLMEKALDYFKQYYGQHFADYTSPYNGILDLLDRLKESGYKTALVSNKNRIFLEKLFNKYFINKIDFYLGESENLMPKPAPDMVEYALKKLIVDKKDAVYVGDSKVDIKTAENSGIDGIFVTWGFSEKQQLIDCGAKEIMTLRRSCWIWFSHPF